MSEIITDKLTGKTSAGDVDVTSEGGAVTFQLQQGLAKAWCKWNASVVVDDSFNQSSMVDVGTGDYEVVFANNFAAASKFAAGALGGHYGVAGGFTSWTGGGNNNTHADRIKVQFVNSAGGVIDADKNSLVVHGDLA